MTPSPHRPAPAAQLPPTRCFKLLAALSCAWRAWNELLCCAQLLQRMVGAVGRGRGVLSGVVSVLLCCCCACVDERMSMPLLYTRMGLVGGWVCRWHRPCARWLTHLAHSFAPTRATVFAMRSARTTGAPVPGAHPTPTKLFTILLQGAARLPSIVVCARRGSSLEHNTHAVTTTRTVGQQAAAAGMRRRSCACRCCAHTPPGCC